MKTTNKFVSMSLVLFVSAVLFIVLASCTVTTDPTANALSLSTVNGAEGRGAIKAGR